MPEPEQTNTIADSSAFKGCSDATLQRIYAEGHLVRFNIGHILSTAEIIPNRVLFILNGNVRIISKHRGQLNSLTQLGVGNLIGLASLLELNPVKK